MRKIEQTGRFRRDYKRELKGRHGTVLPKTLTQALELLLVDASLPARYRDHPLTGDWADYRDCHLKPDLVLIYRKPDDDTLQLVRIGSHSELGL